MDGSQVEKLNRSKRFQEDVDVMEEVFFDFFLEKDVLDLNSKEKLLSIPTAAGRKEEFMKIMKELPAEKKAFQHILEALRSTEMESYKEIADEIEGMETYSDPSVRAKVHPSHHEAAVHEVLIKNFIHFREKSTDINDIRHVLEENQAFPLDAPWSNKQIADFVCTRYVGLERFKKRVGLRKKVLCFKHLAKIDPNDVSLQMKPKEVSTSMDKAKDLCCEKSVNVDISSLSPAELRTFLEREFEKGQLPVDPLKELEAEHINGEILLSFSEDDLKEVVPSFKFAHRRMIKLIIEKCQTEKESTMNTKKSFEIFRHFDKDVKPTDGYVEGRLVDTTIQTRAKKTVPIRNFHLPEFESEDDTRHYILEQCAIFTAACINERRNGTIYFGISPEDKGVRKKGEVVGLDITLAKMDDLLLDFFYLNQQSIIKNTLRNVKCVPVIKSEHTDNTLYVMEFDVVPGTFLNESEYIKINTKSFPRTKKKWKVRDPIFTFCESGMPKSMTPNESCTQSKISSSTIEQRRIDESTDLQQVKPNINRLRNHLTGGSDTIDDDIYTFLILSPIKPSLLDFDNFEFIRHLQPEVVFDFDPNGDPDGIFNALENERGEVMKAVTLDNFDEKEKDKKDIETFQTDLVGIGYTNWVFCNGYGQMEEMESVQWNKKRSVAFQKAFKHYLQNCCKSRVLIIICLFSPNYEVLLEACHDVLKELSDQWVMLSETQSVADKWQETFTMRHLIDISDLKERCIIGLPWEKVNEGIVSWRRREDTFECQIPDSSGGDVRIDTKKVNEWCDVEVLSSLDPVHPDEDEETLKAKQKEVEQHFYCGGQVKWLNFYSDHVCRRKIHDELYGLVLDALEGKNKEEEDKVLTTYLCHEPGAGGSTSARQILWSLRTCYRCCLVREITDQTIEQLTEIYFFKDKSPKPILVLLDDEDEDKMFQLRVKLERKARNECSSDVFCVLLICYRTVYVPLAKRKQSMVTLKQFLEKQDLSWFEQRYDYLKTCYANPKSLISFNILKENFNKEYIQNTVKDFVEEIKDKNEETILKLVSVINNFDIDFKCIHVSCFDFILDGGPVFRYGIHGSRKISWEANVSESFKVLLNLSSRNNKAKTQRKTIRVFNKLTAEYIQNCIRSKTGESVSDVISLLLTNKIFNEIGQDMKQLQNIISNMMKKRSLKEEGIGKEKFSPFILYMKEQEGIAKAGEIIELLFELNRDPFTAQQIARFYIENKNFIKAETFAKSATSMLPWNSYMWDTHAQVFKAQLFDKVQSVMELVEGELTNEEIKDLIAICQKCTSLFRKEQSVSDKEAFKGSAEINRAGYFGELRSIILMLSAIQKCKSFESKDVVHNFLLDEKYTNARLGFLSEEEKAYLKMLWNYSKETIKKLDDEFLQTKVEIEANPLSDTYEDNKRILLLLRVTLNEYFGETNDKVPAYLTEEDQCKFRWRIVFSRKANSLYNTLQLRHNNEFDVLNESYHLMLQNVKSHYSTPDDVNTLLDIVTVLLIENRIPPGLKYEQLINWSQSLYWQSLRLKINNEHFSLEVFMYFVLYNFPTDERLKFSTLACAQDLVSVLKLWREFFNSRRNMRRVTHRETTLFFLGNGSPLHDIVYYKNIDKVMAGCKHSEKWHLPKVRHILKLMSGFLSETGNYISYCYKNNKGNDNWIEIKTSNRINKQAWFQKRIYFYLGFSFSGIKAYGIIDKHSITESSCALQTKISQTKMPSAHQTKAKQNVKPLGELESRKNIIINKIGEKKRRKEAHGDLERELHMIEDSILEIIGD